MRCGCALDLGTLLLREIAALRFGEEIGPLLPEGDLESLLRRDFWLSLAERALSYLQFLEGSLLLKVIPSLELRLKRPQSHSRLCLCDHSLRAGWLQEVVPLDPQVLRDTPHLADLAGHLAESAVGYFLSGLPHLGVAHFPQRVAEPEVDFVLTVGYRRIPLEVKYHQQIDPHRDTLGLEHFLGKAVYSAPLGILVTMNDGVEVPDPRIVSLSLPSLLLLR